MIRYCFKLFSKSSFKYASLIIASSCIYKAHDLIQSHKKYKFQFPFIQSNDLQLAECKKALDKSSAQPQPISKLYTLFRDTKIPTVFIFHSKFRPFHQSFVNTAFKLFQNHGIHVLTVDSISDIQYNQFSSIIPNLNQLNQSSYMPKVLFKNGQHVIQLDPYNLMDIKNDQYFKTQYSRHFIAEKFNSVGQLILLLKKFNKRLQDSVCVMFKKIQEQSQDKRSPAEKIRQSNPLAWNAMSSYNKAMLITHDQQLAKELKLQQGYFYIYYKPSYINGFEDFIYSKADTNVEAFQAVEGMCRDRFKFNQEFKFPKKYSKFIKKTKNGERKYLMVTPQMVKNVIDRGDQAFERTYNTQFLMQTNLDYQHIKTSTFKPIVLLYMKDDLAEFLVPKLKNLMEKFAGQFEFYFTSDEQQAQKYFPVQDLLGIPYIMIIDNSKKVPIKGNHHMMEKYLTSGSKIDFNQQYDLKTGQAVPKKKQQQEANGNEDKSKNMQKGSNKSVPKQILQNYLLSDSAVYTNQIFKIQSFEHEVQDFLKKYYSGELYHQYLAPFSKPLSEVKDVNTKLLYSELKSKKSSANQCIVQAYAPSCASCQFNGKVFNGFSRKLKKHGMLKDLPLYRMDSRNVSPIFGRFPYTPMYFFIKYERIEQDNKSEVVIKQIDKIAPVVKFNQFKQELMQKANLPPDFDEKIKLSPQEQFQSYFMQRDLEQSYDPDFDYNQGRKAEEQYKQEKQKEAKNQSQIKD